ncbi:MAG: histidine kinase N-terminal 7TM domain-containing protein [bacterium]
MIDIQSTILFLLITFSISSLVLVNYLWGRKRIPGALAYAFVNLSCAIWCVGYIIELWMPDINSKMLGVKVQYTMGIPFVSVFFFFASIAYRTRGRRPTTKEIILSLIIPFITMILMWTDEYHNLMYINEDVQKIGSFVFIVKDWGIWYYVNIAYSYFVLFAGTIILLLSLRKIEKLYRLQTWMLIIGLCISWLFNVIYLAGSSSFMRFDITPIGFAISNAIITFALFRYRLFDVIPAARDTVFESMDNGVIVIDNFERVVDMNPAAIRIFGMRGLIGNSILELFEEFKVDPTEIRSGKISRTEIVYNNINYDLIISPVLDRSYKIAGSVIYFHDITDLKKTQKELSDSNNAKDKFFSIIAHDLKNPFFGIIGLSGMIKEDYSIMTDDQKKEMVTDINELAVNTYKLLENLLEWSRQQTGTIEFTPKLFNLSSLIDENIKSVKQRAQLKNIGITPDYEEEVFVFADENMINTVIRNLISNALKFTNPEGLINVSVKNIEHYIRVSVTDNGVGMNVETKKKLFRIEYNIKSIGTSGEKGSGLGLLLCKEFVDRNGGKMWAESEIDKGSTFYFSLPLKESLS